MNDSSAPNKAKFAPEDRAFLAALLAPPPREALRRLRLLLQPDTVLRWHRDLTTLGHQDRSRHCLGDPQAGMV